ncbi:type II secretion system F family protein [Modestobacter lapidis]|nr:pilus assembly protein TadB [Modestobacter lapidis]
MTGALCCLAAAAVCWPARGVQEPPGRLRATRSVPAVELGALVDRPGAVGAGGLLAAAVVAVASTPLVAALAGVCAGAAVRALRGARRAAEGRRRVQAVAEGLGVLAAELRAGRSVEEAADAAVAGCPDEVAGAALGRVLRPGAGPPTPAAGSPGDVDGVLARVAAAVRLSARTGCSLAGVAAAVEDDLRARARAETELRAAVAGPRASAAVLAGLPVLGLLMGGGVGADPWRVLTTTGTGTVLLVCGVALELAGVAWSARLVRRAVTR